jgi:hypothetical protein
MSGKPAKYVAVEDLIITIRGQRVIIDSDLAKLYGVSTMRLNEQVKRNNARFPKDFVFRLTPGEKSEVIANRDNLKKLKFSPALPNAFTEHGAIMAANVLNSPRAIEMSVFVVRAFVKMREYLGMTHVLEKRLAEIEKKLLLHDSSLRDLYERIRPLLLPPPEKPPKRRIGYLEEPRALYRVRLEARPATPAVPIRKAR